MTLIFYRYFPLFFASLSYSCSHLSYMSRLGLWALPTYAQLSSFSALRNLGFDANAANGNSNSAGSYGSASGAAGAGGGVGRGGRGYFDNSALVAADGYGDDDDQYAEDEEEGNYGDGFEDCGGGSVFGRGDAGGSRRSRRRVEDGRPQTPHEILAVHLNQVLRLMMLGRDQKNKKKRGQTRGRRGRGSDSRSLGSSDTDTDDDEDEDDSASEGSENDSDEDGGGDGSKEEDEVVVPIPDASTPFRNFAAFLSAMDEAGVSGMEVVAMEMKR